MGLRANLNLGYWKKIIRWLYRLNGLTDRCLELRPEFCHFISFIRRALGSRALASAPIKDKSILESTCLKIVRNHQDYNIGFQSLHHKQLTCKLEGACLQRMCLI